MASIKRHLVLGSLLVGALAVPMLASADDMSAAASPVASPTPEAWYQSIQVGGYADVYFQQSFNSPNDTINPTYDSDKIYERAYNNTANQFTFGGAELTLKDNDAATGTGVFVDLMMGGSLNSLYGNQTSYYNFDYSDQYGEDDAIAVGQAYITQAFGNLNFTLGKFATPIGYESTYLPSDANFSRSLLWQMEPTFSTGLEASYNLPMGFTVAGWVDNGPSTDDTYNNGRGYGAQVGYAGIKNLNLTGTYYYDDTESHNNAIEHSDLDDFVASYSATDSLSFAGEFLNETKPQVPGASHYLQTSG
ncbi:MAG: outer membrane beta-barrel protein, partial [bacterium]